MTGLQPVALTRCIAVSLGVARSKGVICGRRIAVTALYPEIVR